MKKLEISFINEQFKKGGYNLLTKYYVSSGNKLDYICDRGHFGSMSWDKWKQGIRCPICSCIRISDSQRLEYKFVKDKFKKEEYTLLSEKYINNRTKLTVKCNEGHVIDMTYDSFNSGHRCMECAKEKIGNALRLNINYIRNFLAEKEYTLISDNYKNNMEHITVKCPNNHIWRITFSNFQKGTRCPQCSEHGISKAETEVYEFLQPYFGDIERNSRTLIPPYEIDIVVPSKKTAIEYCGLYWHSESAGKDKNYHLEKLNMCNQAGYNLITIFEDEWLHKQDIVQNRLLHILNIQDTTRIHARKCTIKEITPATKNSFLNKFHIQGKDNASIKLGAFDKNRLVAVMTFSKLSISKGSKDTEGCYELSRFCIDYDYNIPGIASKLFSYFRNNYQFKSVTTFGDKRWSTGNLYETIGFEYVHDSKPNYWYIEQDKRVHRFNFRKSVLKDKLESFDPYLTEIENMENNGYTRIFDCGNSKWRYNNETYTIHMSQMWDCNNGRIK